MAFICLRRLSVVGQLEDSLYTAAVFFIRRGDQTLQTVPVFSYPIDRDLAGYRQFELFLQIVFKLDGTVACQAFIILRVPIGRGVTE